MNPQLRRQVGTTNLRVTQFGLGGAGIGGIFRKLDADAVERTIQLAYDAGVRYFDTAPLYGHGLSEIRLGRGLQNYPRNDYVISTKVGYTLVPRQADEPASRADFADSLPFNHIFDYSRDAILRSLDGSMQRLGTDRVDLVYIHDPDESMSIYANQDPYAKSHFREVMEGAYPALAELRAQGVIHAIGVGMNQCEMLCDFAERGDFDCFLLAGRYTLLHQDALDQLLPLCEKKHISIIIGAPFQSGILAMGAAAKDTKYNYQPPPAEVQARVRKLQAVCDEYSVPLPAAALQFAFGHPSIISVIPGSSSPHELTANLQFFQQAIPTAFWQALQDAKLIDARAPFPKSI